MSLQQQRFHLTSLRITGRSCPNVQLIQLLIIYGSYLRRLRIDWGCLLDAMQIDDVTNQTQLRRVIFHKYLTYVQIDNIDALAVHSGDFPRIVALLFDDMNSLRHVSLLTHWYLEIFESTEDAQALITILSSFKHCTQLISISICRCEFSNQSSANETTVIIENGFEKWFNANMHRISQRNFQFEYDHINKVLKLWFEQMTNNSY